MFEVAVEHLSNGRTATEPSNTTMRQLCDACAKSTMGFSACYAQLFEFCRVLASSFISRIASFNVRGEKSYRIVRSKHLNF